MEAYKQGVRVFFKYSDSLSLKKLVGSMMIATHGDLEHIGEAGRFKNRESSKYFVESSTSKLCTSQYLDKRFIFFKTSVD